MTGRAAQWRARATGLDPRVVDGLLAAVSAAVSLWSVSQDETARPWWVYLLALGTSLPLPWRRRAPVTVLVLSGGLSAVLSVLAHSAMPQLPLYAVIALYTVADRAGERQRWTVLAVTVVANVVGTHSPNGALFSLLTSVGAFVFGCLVRELRRLAAVEAERAREAGRRAASDAARAVVEERARIAREMHDILAHAVSLMVIQAEAGPLVVRSDPDRAVKTFDTIADAGRDAMGQLRRVLGVLKEDGAVPELAPQPRLAELPVLAERVRRAGVVVELELDERVGPLPAGVEAAGYRIVQEALTNTVKHAEAGRIGIRVVREGAELVVLVSDNGRGVRADREPGVFSGGRGLVGIRERAAACGGRAEAGPGPGGRGFLVSARLPLGGGEVVGA
ncbi:Signal transduction histidine kinase [Streptomyces sp. TLI_053]|uniref:sensor histidine kinase n=1 Tax=Streptomyces sp. TLI_053 TaxID=1855352 RepID=UPI00087ABD4F|nr:sensor histidine kinase [Streptomyces sp. TLI_053]SDT74192.1 Signal transduction histidine kinase [Streptomyces sp. TLI_053]